jgi:hypothetical protein
MKNSFEAVKNTLNEMGIDFFEKEEKSILFSTSGDNARYVCIVSVNSNISEDFGDIITMSSSCSEIVPDEKRAMILESLNILNFNLLVGSFFLDHGSVVSFRTGIQLPGNQLTQEIVKNLMLSNIVIMDGSYPKISQVINQDADSSKIDDMDIFRSQKSDVTIH